MFSLPSLGILSSPAAESLSFKGDQVNGLARLYTDPVPAKDHAFYAKVMCHFSSTAHAFDTFSVREARLIRDRQPENLKTLVHLLVLHLESLKDDAEFAKEEEDSQGFASLGRWAAAPFSPLTSAFGGSSAGKADQPRDRTKEALNCARLLARLLPVLMESQTPNAFRGEDKPYFASPLEEEILWSRKLADIEKEALEASSKASKEAAPSSAASESQDQFVIDDEEQARDSKEDSKEQSEDPLAGSGAAAPAAAPAAKSEDRPALAERLIALCVDFLFFPGFTLPALEHLPDDDDDLPGNSRVHFVIWSKGIGSSVDLEGTTKQHLANRAEILRLLLVLLSKSVCVPPQLQNDFHDRALQFTTTSLSRTVTLPLLCSLLNTACDANLGGGWTPQLAVPGWGSSGDVDARENLRSLSFQALAILLEWQPNEQESSGADADATRPRIDRTVSTISTVSNNTASSVGLNQFGYWTSKIHRTPDLNMLSSTLFSLLRLQAPSLMSLPSVVSPGSANASSSGVYSQTPEAMTLLWYLLRNNAKFRTYVIDDAVRAPLLLGLLLGHALAGKDSPASHGLVRLALFTLQDVSATTTFATQIAKPGSANKLKLPSKFAALANGASTAAEILIAGCYTLLMTKGMGSGGLGIQPVVLLILCNCAPYFASLNIPSATRLSLLLTQFSNPTFLLADEGHPQGLYFLLETINAILFFQPSSNHNVIYALLNKSREVERLQHFTLRRGIAEIRRRTGLAGLSSEGATPASTPSGVEEGLRALSVTDPSAEAEKARLAAREAEGDSSQAPTSTVKDGETVAAAAAAAARGVEGEEALGPDGGPRVPSEKALGKVRKMSQTSSDESRPPPPMSAAMSVADSARSASSRGPGSDPSSDEWVDRLDDGELYEAASRVGKNGFVPTESWVQSWVAGLPLGPLVRLQSKLLPEMEVLCASEAVANKADADQRVMSWLREQDLNLFSNAAKGLEPLSRPFKWTDQVTIWLRSYLWGAVYLFHSNHSVWPGDSVRLFYLVQQPGLKEKEREKDNKKTTATTTTTPAPPASQPQAQAETQEAQSIGESSAAATTPVATSLETSEQAPAEQERGGLEVKQQGEV